METWKPVVGYEGLYEVSDLGRVKSLVREAPQGRFRPETVLKGRASHGYVRVGLWRDGKKRDMFVHCVELTAFKGRAPAGLQCRHDDGDRMNNRLTNLRWGTGLLNARDRGRHGTTVRGERHWAATLHEGDVRAIRADARLQATIAAAYGVHKNTVQKIKQGTIWRHV